ncbi:MAG: hypothetical protein LKJ86_02750 [Oscillibacter sp.]|jgi:regulatory protein YycI of two-component signal transduction system YycFG|nr:hypothetical protein [Oscillibacter sp.]
MERFRLKNVIILILVLVNVFLLSSLAIRQAERTHARSRTLDELAALCSSDSIQLKTTLPNSMPPIGKTLARSSAVDEALAISVLGKDAALTDEGGGISTGSTAAGQAFFRADGTFTITGKLADGDVEDFCRKFCRSNGYKDFSVNANSESAGNAARIFATAVQYFEGNPVANATVEFMVQNDILISISGTHLPDTGAETTGTGSMTAATALSRFLNARLESGAVVSEITDIYPCYELQSTTASPMSLSPAWCIVTDTADYYVNSLTGAVSHS